MHLKLFLRGKILSLFFNLKQVIVEKYLYEDFIFPMHFYYNTLNVYILNCEIDFYLEMVGKDMRLRNYKTKTKIKNLQVAEILDGNLERVKRITINIDLGTPIIRGDFFKGFDRTLKTNQLKKDFPLTYKLLEEYGWESVIKKS